MEMSTNNLEISEQLTVDRQESQIDSGVEDFDDNSDNGRDGKKSTENVYKDDFIGLSEGEESPSQLLKKLSISSEEENDQIITEQNEVSTTFRRPSRPTTSRPIRKISRGYNPCIQTQIAKKENPLDQGGPAITYNTELSNGKVRLSGIVSDIEDSTNDVPSNERDIAYTSVISEVKSLRKPVLPARQKVESTIKGEKQENKRDNGPQNQDLKSKSNDLNSSMVPGRGQNDTEVANSKHGARSKKTENWICGTDSVRKMSLELPRVANHFGQGRLSPNSENQSNRDAASGKLRRASDPPRSFTPLISGDQSTFIDDNDTGLKVTVIDKQPSPSTSSNFKKEYVYVEKTRSPVGKGMNMEDTNSPVEQKQSFAESEQMAKEGEKVTQSNDNAVRFIKSTTPKQSQGADNREKSRLEEEHSSKGMFGNTVTNSKEIELFLDDHTLRYFDRSNESSLAGTADSRRSLGSQGSLRGQRSRYDSQAKEKSYSQSTNKNSVTNVLLINHTGSGVKEVDSRNNSAKNVNRKLSDQSSFRSSDRGEMYRKERSISEGGDDLYTILKRKEVNDVSQGTRKASSTNKPLQLRVRFSFEEGMDPYGRKGQKVNLEAIEEKKGKTKRDNKYSEKKLTQTQALPEINGKQTSGKDFDHKIPKKEKQFSRKIVSNNPAKKSGNSLNRHPMPTFERKRSNSLTKPPIGVLTQQTLILGLDIKPERKVKRNRRYSIGSLPDTPRSKSHSTNLVTRSLDVLPGIKSSKSEVEGQGQNDTADKNAELGSFIGTLQQKEYKKDEPGSEPAGNGHEQLDTLDVSSKVKGQILSPSELVQGNTPMKNQRSASENTPSDSISPSLFLKGSPESTQDSLRNEISFTLPSEDRKVTTDRPSTGSSDSSSNLTIIELNSDWLNEKSPSSNGQLSYKTARRLSKFSYKGPRSLSAHASLRGGLIKTIPRGLKRGLERRRSIVWGKKITCKFCGKDSTGKIKEDSCEIFDRMQTYMESVQEDLKTANYTIIIEQTKNDLKQVTLDAKRALEDGRLAIEREIMDSKKVEAERNLARLIQGKDKQTGKKTTLFLPGIVTTADERLTYRKIQSFLDRLRAHRISDERGYKRSEVTNLYWERDVKLSFYNVINRLTMMGLLQEAEELHKVIERKEQLQYKLESAVMSERIAKRKAREEAKRRRREEERRKNQMIIDRIDADRRILEQGRMETRQWMLQWQKEMKEIRLREHNKIRKEAVFLDMERRMRHPFAFSFECLRKCPLNEALEDDGQRRQKSVYWLQDLRARKKMQSLISMSHEGLDDSDSMRGDSSMEADPITERTEALPN